MVSRIGLLSTALSGAVFVCGAVSAVLVVACQKKADVNPSPPAASIGSAAGSAVVSEKPAVAPEGSATASQNLAATQQQNPAAPAVSQQASQPVGGGELDLPRVTPSIPVPLAGARIYSKRRHVWIYYEPNSDGGWTGFLGLGGSVALRDDNGEVTPRPGPGCASYYPIKPRGWVCLNEKTTLDPNDPEYVAITKFAPRLDQPLPHNYGESRGLPRYLSIPTEQQQRAKEYKLDEHLQTVDQMRRGELVGDKVPKALQGVDVTKAGHGPPDAFSLLPRSIPENRDYLKPLSTVAWSHQFDAHGRTWLVTADLALVPKDKVTPYPKSSFQGVSLEKQVRLPVAFVRYEDRARWRKTASGDVENTGKPWPRMSILPIEDGPPIVLQGTKYYIVKPIGDLVRAEDASVARLAPSTPWGVAVPDYKPLGELDTRGKPNSVAVPKSERKTWVEVSVLGGWMVAYENTRPVFATLIAPGRGGVPVKGVDPLKTASTPVGTFRVDGKFFTATMANEAFVHSDVPFSQNFHGPHVLHQAYWHDGWGEKRSAGCINLSPIDSLWFFHWTDPPMPEGWFGMRSDQQAGPATIVWVHS